jgi:hypothetical protein
MLAQRHLVDAILGNRQDQCEITLTIPDAALGGERGSPYRTAVLTQHPLKALAAQLGRQLLAEKKQAYRLNNRGLAGTIDAGKTGPVPIQAGSVRKIDLERLEVLKVLDLDLLDDKRPRWNDDDVRWYCG